MSNYHHILLATDLHSNNFPIIKRAVTTAKNHRAKLSVINILPDIPSFITSGLDSLEDLQNHLEEESFKKMKILESQIEYPADFHVKYGDPKKKIVALSTELNCDLIIVGNKKNLKDSKYTVGTTAIGVLTRAHCDVLIVNLFKK